MRVAIEDCIMQKGEIVTAGSKILSGFVGSFDAAVVEKMKAAGISLVGVVPMDEFGLESDDGNSKSGAVAAVADGTADCVLCNDVWGAVSRAAAESGLCYIRPTYGTVSRYGLIQIVSSMDQIGIVCKNPTDGYKLLEVIAGNDSRDGAMLADSFAAESGEVRLAACGVDLPSAKEIKFACEEQSETVRQVLGYAELCNNTNRYDGIKFGYRTANYVGINDVYVNTRSEAFTKETKLAVIMGGMVLSQGNYEQYYEKAMKIRRVIKESVDFNGYDVLALTAGHALPVLTGLPSLTASIGGRGVQLVANVKKENALLGAWEVLCREV